MEAMIVARFIRTADLILQTEFSNDFYQARGLDHPVAATLAEHRICSVNEAWPQVQNLPC
jgi:hypothetical protein